MKHRRGSLPPPSRSSSKSAPVSPAEERPAPIHGNAPTTVAFVPFEIASTSGVGQDTRRAVRVQAAKASAATRKRTIAKKLAVQRGTSYDNSNASSAASTEGERRRKQSATSALEHELLTLSPSPGPARTLSAGQLEPFQPYPVPRWHPQIPALVDHFLRYFAPDSAEGGYGREALRDHLWPEALVDTSLFHSILLTVASHASLARAQEVSTQLLAQLKRTAIEGINSAIARSEITGGIGDAVIASISLLGAWELLYGSIEAYETHMRGLETIVNLRGGLYETQSPYPGFALLSPSLATLILSAGHDLALYAGKRPYFVCHDNQTLEQIHALSEDTHAGLRALHERQLVIPCILQHLASLQMTGISPQDHSHSARLEEIRQAIYNWSLDSVTQAGYCASQTLFEDHLKRQICALIRLAGLATCAFLQPTSTANLQALQHTIYNETQQLDVEALIGTQYEEVAFWALFIVCSITGRCEARHMHALKRMQLEQGLHKWSEVERVLSKYVYSAALLEARAQALWQAVNSSTIARETTPSPREPTRFAKAIRHPTNYLGDGISAEEG